MADPVTNNNTAGSSLPAAGGTSTGNLADWVQPYVTGDNGYLTKAAALADQPYQAYQGPLTAGASDLQTQAFQGIGNLTVPTAVTNAANTAGDIANKFQGMSYDPTTFTSSFNAPSSYNATTFQNTYNAPSPYQTTTYSSNFNAPSTYQGADYSGINMNGVGPYNQVTGSFTDAGTAQKYMNPYIQQALNPTLDEIRRQAQITQMGNDARMVGAGAFGGSRQALMNAETQRNLLTQLANTTGQGYATAYDKAASQYNTEQDRKIGENRYGYQSGVDLAKLRAQLGLDVATAQDKSNQARAAYGLDYAKAKSAAEMEAQRNSELSRQYGYGQLMANADKSAGYGLDALKASEASRQFGANYGLDYAKTKAAADLEAAKASEQSKQFGANYGLSALNDALTAAQTQANMGIADLNAQQSILNGQLQAGNTQRAITAEGIAADKAEFDKQQQYPYEQLKFQQSMLTGLPISSVSNTPSQLSGIAQIAAAMGGMDKLMTAMGVSDMSSLLKLFGLNTTTSTANGTTGTGSGTTGTGGGTTGSPAPAAESPAPAAAPAPATDNGGNTGGTSEDGGAVTSPVTSGNAVGTDLNPADQYNYQDMTP